MSLKSFGEKGKIDGCPQSWSETWELIHYLFTSFCFRPPTIRKLLINQSVFIAFVLSDAIKIIQELVGKSPKNMFCKNVSGKHVLCL